MVTRFVSTYFLPYRLIVMIILQGYEFTYAYGLSYELILILELIIVHSAVILLLMFLSYMVDSSLPDDTSSAGGLLERCGPTV